MEKDYEYLCAFIVATDTEMEGQKALFDRQEHALSDGEDCFYETAVQRDGERHKPVLAQTTEQGMAADSAQNQCRVHFGAMAERATPASALRHTPAPNSQSS